MSTVDDNEGNPMPTTSPGTANEHIHDRLVTFIDSVATLAQIELDLERGLL